MKFTPAPDSAENIVCRKVSENNLIEIGVFHVLYGHRIRVSYVGAQWCELDYCAGASQQQTELLYAIVEQILSLQDEKTIDWSIFPEQKIKPVFNDNACWGKLVYLASDMEGKIPKLPDLYEIRNRLHQDMGLLMGMLGAPTKDPDSD